MKKKFLISVIVLFVLCSCEQPKSDSKNDVPKQNELKYQVEVVKKTGEQFDVIYLNKFTGKVYIRIPNGNWFEVVNSERLTISKTPVYSMHIIENGEKYQILVSNLKNGDLFITPNLAGWYNASGIHNVELVK